MASIINATTTNGVAVQGDNSGSLQLQTNSGTTAVTIDTSQNATFANSVLGTASTFQVGVNTSGKDARFGVLSGGNGRVEFYSAGSEAMRIDTSGNLSVGTTSNSRGARLRVDGNETSHFTGYGNGYGVGIYMTPNASATGTHTVISFQNPSATTVGTITSTSSATAYNTSSDYRLKENIAPMIGALAKVAQLKPVTYKWKSDGSDGQGFIAHELQAVVPDCVTGEKDAVETVDDVDADGKVIGTKEVPKYQGVDTSFLVATLTAAIQELKAELDATKAEVQALKGVA